MSDSGKAGDYTHITSLPLRTKYFDDVDAIIKSDDAMAYCMMTVDIQNFHFFNRWYGRERGDQLLAAIGDFLEDVSERYGTIAGYLGGDNFSIFFQFSGWMVNNVTDAIQDIVRSFAPEDPAILPVFGAYRLLGVDILDNVTAADMYDYTICALKQASEEAICWFESASIRKREEELRMLPEVLAAIDNDEFTFFLQPKCHLKSGKVIGAEALVRWISPEKGMISPGVFIPLLENHGLITRLDLIVWEKVCAQLKAWRDEGLRILPVSVNVSRVDILQLDVAMTFEHLVEKYDLEPSNVEIEITESAYTDDDRSVIETVNRLHKAGFKVLIDDFGSGYSSLNLLKDIQADVLKLDMKFLGGSDGNEDKSFSIIESILEMSRQLSIPAIIEGVEQSKQIEALEDLGCEYAQGYFYYRPMPYVEYEKLLRDSSIIGEKRVASKLNDKSHLQKLSEYFIKVANVNILSGDYVFLRTDDLHRKMNNPEAPTIKEYIQRFVDAELIHGDDVPEYQKLFDRAYLEEQIKKGKRRFLHSLRYLYNEGVYSWVVFEITVPEDFSMENNPVLLYTWKHGDGRISRTEDLTYLLSLTFYKLLKVNLETRSFEILQLVDGENIEDKGYSTDIQEWLTGFAETGNVHKDDKEAFISFADVDKIKRHFTKSDKPISVAYRRKVGRKFVPVEMTICKSMEYISEAPYVLLYIAK